MSEFSRNKHLEGSKLNTSLIIHFFPGFLKTYRESAILERELLLIPEVDEVIAGNSVFSRDRPTYGRFPKMGELLLKSFRLIASNKAGRVVIVVNSGGGGEVASTWGVMMRINPELVEESLRNTDFFLISTAGLMGGFNGAVTTLKRALRLSRSQLDTPVINKFPNEVAGIESLLLFPSPHLGEDDKLTTFLRVLYPEWSNFEAGINIIPHLPDGRYLKGINPQINARLIEIDYQIRLLASSVNPESTVTIKEKMSALLKSRALLLKQELRTSYAGEDPKGELANPEALSVLEKFAIPFLAFADKVNVVKAILSGSLGKLLNQLIEAGSLSPSQLHYFIPEYDVFLTFPDVDGLNPNLIAGRRERITILARATHAGWIRFGKQLADAIKQIYLSPSS